jgi:hypothetical protein
MNTPLAAILPILLCGAPMADEPKSLVLDRLTKTPESLTETFYPVDGSPIEVNDGLIRQIGIATEAGKSHARISIAYHNTGNKALTPNYILRLYNSYGILMSWVRVPKEASTARTLKPASTGTEWLKPRIVRLDRFFRHSTLEEYPDDFFKLRWVSLDTDHGKVGPE